MQTSTGLNGFLALAILLSAFPPNAAGETQITITEEFKGKIREQKPQGLFHHLTGETTPEAGLTPSQVTEIKGIIETVDLPVVRDALENAVVLNLYQKGNYAALLNEAQSYLEKYPQGDPRLRPQLLFYAAEAFYYQGDYQEAMLGYREVRNKYASSDIYALAQLGLAWSLMHLGRYQEARMEFKRFSPATTEEFVASEYGWAITEYNDENYRVAVTHFREEEEYRSMGIWGDLTQSLVPKNLYYKALAYYRAGEQKQAISYFRRVAEDYPDHPKAGRATFLVGWLSFQSDENEQAIDYFNKALKLVSDSSEIREIRMILSQAYLNADRLRECIDNWKEIKQNWGPSIANTGLEIAYTKLTREGFDEEWAADSIENLLKDFADNLPASSDLPSFQCQLAERFYREGDFQKTLEWSSKALAGQANQNIVKKAQHLRLFSLFKVERWQQLVEEGRNYIAQYPAEKQGNVAFVVGAGYSYRGDELKEENPTRAQDHFRKAIPLFEAFLQAAPEDHPNRQQAQDLLEHCRINSR